MRPTRNKIRAIERLLGLRQRAQEHAQAELQAAHAEVAQTEALLQTPRAVVDTAQRAEDLAVQQMHIDVGYRRLAGQKRQAEALQTQLQNRHAELRQIETWHEHAQAERRQSLEKEAAQDSDAWLRRGKK